MTNPTGFMFESCEYYFCAGGIAYDKMPILLGRNTQLRKVSYRVVEGVIHWVWDDGTTVEASEEIQKEWNRFVGKLVTA